MILVSNKERSAHTKPLQARNFVSGILFLSVLVASTNAFSQDQPVRLIHADSLIGYTRGGDSYRDLVGHVTMQHENTIMKCDRAVQNLTQDVVHLYGNVRVDDDTLTLITSEAEYFGKSKTVTSDSAVYLNDIRRTLTADSGRYDTDTKKADFFGHVAVRDSVSRLTSDKLTYFRSDAETFAEGDVDIKSLQNDVTVRGKHFEDYDKRHYSLITGLPLLVQIDTASDGKIDTLTIASSRMEAYRDSSNERFVAHDTVRVIRGALSARCGYGTYYSKDSIVVLQKSPVVWYEDNQLTGDSIVVHIKNKKLSEVDVIGSAFAISLSDSAYPDRYNQLKGKLLRMYLNDRKVDHIVVENNATSLYYLYDKDKPNGVNRVSGDSVIMYFQDGKIERISVMSGVEGNYYPEKLVKGKVSEYSLAGYSYRKDRPDKKNFPNNWK